MHYIWEQVVFCRVRACDLESGLSAHGNSTVARPIARSELHLLLCTVGKVGTSLHSLRLEGDNLCRSLRPLLLAMGMDWEDVFIGEMQMRMVIIDTPQCILLDELKMVLTHEKLQGHRCGSKLHSGTFWVAWIPECPPSCCPGPAVNVPTPCG